MLVMGPSATLLSVGSFPWFSMALLGNFGVLDKKVHVDFVLLIILVSFSILVLVLLTLLSNSVDKNMI